MKFAKKLKSEWSDLLLGELTPHSFALGLSIGTMIALLPTFGFSVLLSLVLIFIFPHINRPALIIALIIWNPLTQIPVYALSFQIGSILFSGMTVVEYDFEILSQLYSFTRRFLVAHMLVTMSITVLTYVVSRYYVYSKFIK